MSRRFSEFFTFHQALGHRFPCLPPFPNRTLVKSQSTTFVNERRDQLQTYIDQITRRLDINKSPLFNKFFSISAPESDSEFKDVSILDHPDCATCEGRLEFPDTRVTCISILREGEFVAVGTSSTSTMAKVGKAFSSILSFLKDDADDVDQTAKNSGDFSGLGRVHVFRRVEGGGKTNYVRCLTIALKAEVTCVDWDITNHWLYVACADGTFSIFNPSSDFGYAVQSLQVQLHTKTICAMHRVGDLLATVSHSGGISVYNIDAQDIIFEAKHSGSRLTSVHCDMENFRLFVGTFAREILIFNLHNPSYDDDEVPPALLGHNGSVRCIDYHSDSRLLVSGGFDEQIILWQMGDADEEKEKTELIGYLKGHKSRIKALHISEDGRYIVTGDADGFVCVWDAQLKCSLCMYHIFFFNPFSLLSILPLLLLLLLLLLLRLESCVCGIQLFVSVALERRSDSFILSFQSPPLQLRSEPTGNQLSV